MDRAAAGPPFRALAQCSTRTRRPSSGLKEFATSPAAKMSGSEVRSASSVSTPLPVSRPARAARSSLGAAPMPTTRMSAGIFGAAGRDDHAGAELDRLLAEPELHAVRPVQVREDGAELGAELVVQRAGLRLEHGHRALGRAGGRGGLQADPAGSGHHDPGARLEGRTEPVGIGDRTEVEHLLAVGAGEVEAARRGAGGEQQLVVGHLRAAGRGGHGARAAVDRRDGDALAQVHAVLGVPVGGVHVDRVPRVAAEQVALGQRRALVGTLRLRQPISTMSPSNPSSRSVSAALAPARLAPAIT